MHLWVNDECSFENLDLFLRGIWLECCGHMSSFRIPKNKSNKAGMFGMMDAYEYLESSNIKKYNQLMKEANGQVPMEDKLKDHAEIGLQIEYEYDFGSSTILDITIVNEYPIMAPQEIVLLSRNEPVKYTCVSCGKNTAVLICTACSWNEDAEFCSKCAKEHEKNCEDFIDMQLPIVNSPRTGVCAYMGGEIDKDRD